MKKKILVVSHDSKVGGAQNSILNFIKILSTIGFEVHIILKQDGSLKEEFEKIGICYLWNKIDISNSNFLLRGLNKIINLNKFFNSKISEKIIRLNPELCISNTITNHEIVKDFYQSKIKIITWVHELSYMFRVIEKASLENPKELIINTEFFLCASKAVQKYLIEIHAVPIEKTYVINEIINDKIEGVQTKKSKILTVGGCGTLGWRKGSDLFLAVADELINKLQVKDIYFEWLGAQNNSIGLLQFQQEIKKLGLEKFVKGIPFEINSNNFMERISLFLMTSREDAFPLVNLEAGLYESPILCFGGTGGSEEIAIKENIFKYGDTLSMAKRAKFYKENISSLETDSKISYQKASEFTKQSKTKEVEELIQKLL